MRIVLGSHFDISMNDLFFIEKKLFCGAISADMLSTFNHWCFGPGTTRPFGTILQDGKLFNFYLET